MANSILMNRFTENPTRLDMPRSKMGYSHGVTTSWNIGEVIPFEVTEVLPGDSWQFKTNKIVRLQTLLTPMMGNIFLDTMYFFVPNRLVWKHWQEFMGENTQSAWVPQATYTIPQITSPASTGWNVGTIADYMGIPTGVPGLSVSALPFRAYALIMNEWFRSTALTDPLNIPDGDATQTGSNGGSYINDVANGGKPFIAAKLHDFYTSALPAPQRGPAVTIGLNSMTGAVYGTGYSLALTDGSTVGGLFNHGITNGRFLQGEITGAGKTAGQSVTPSGQFIDNKAIGVPTKAQLAAVTGSSPEWTGLTAEIGSSAMVTINELRTAFQIQKYYEALARSGDRYTEVLRGFFGVTSPDARLQRPEYLGGNRITLNVTSVTQSSETGNTPQGTQAAYSVTGDSNGDFFHSFVEHGYIIGVCVARYRHTYQQGINKMWSRKTIFDFYWPTFANLGEMPILNKEIYAQGSSVVDSDGNPYDEQVFGYQEAWADYRYKPSIVTGEMRSSYAQSLDSWHLADDYQALPALSDTWLREDKTNVDRVLAVSSSVSNQLFGDFYIDAVATRCMPVYSVPGLIDHH